MITSKEKLIKILNEIPESDLEKVLDFAENLNNHSYHYWTKTSESSLEFWDYAIDNEIWNKI